MNNRRLTAASALCTADHSLRLPLLVSRIVSLAESTLLFTSWLAPFLGRFHGGRWRRLFHLQVRARLWRKRVPLWARSVLPELIDPWLRRDDWWKDDLRPHESEYSSSTIRTSATRSCTTASAIATGSSREPTSTLLRCPSASSAGSTGIAFNAGSMGMSSPPLLEIGFWWSGSGCNDEAGV